MGNDISLIALLAFSTLLLLLLLRQEPVSLNFLLYLPRCVTPPIAADTFKYDA